MRLSGKTCSFTLGGSKGVPFTLTLRNKFLGGAPASLKCSVVALLYRLEFTEETATI